MRNTDYFLWGSFGSVLPQIVGFFLLVAKGQPLPSLNWLLYCGLLFVYMVFAGLFCVAWKPENEFKAIWVGASLPALVAALTSVPPAPPAH